MSPAEVSALLGETRALLEGHFQLSSGLHSDRYVQCARALEHPKAAGRLGAALAALAPKGVQTVVAPALGGVLIGYEVARALGVRFLFAERDGDAMRLRRGFALSPGEKTVVVEDVVTTGKSSGEVLSLVRGSQAECLAVLSIVDRSGGKSVLDAPVRSLIQLPLTTYQPGACPLCAAGTQAIKPGSRPPSGASRHLPPKGGGMGVR